MKKLPLCLLSALAMTACDKPNAEDAAAAPPPPPPAKTAAPQPAPQVAGSGSAPTGDWMWTKANGKQRNSDPLAIKNDRLITPKGTSKTPAPMGLGDDPLDHKSSKSH
jgi:hypothetical protein